MDSGTHKRKPLLYSDLFKSHKSMGVEKPEENNISVSSKFEGSIWSTSSNQSSSCDDSFSSDFGTPLYSDLGSYESEINGDLFVEEEEDEEDNRLANDGDYADYDAVNCNYGSGLYRHPVGFDYGIPPIQVYELKNQPSVSKESPVLRAKRVNGTESTQQHHSMQYRGTERGICHSGSGMQAVFLGGSGLRSGSSGTGVFLPRVTKDQTELKKKSGCCPMVLMPTRVLQALDLHFNRRQDSTAPPPCGGSLTHSCPKDEPTESNRLESQGANDDEIQLPQEWTY